MQSPAILLLALQLQSQPAETLLHQAAEALRTATTLHLEITTEREILSENHRTWTRTREVIAKANNAFHYEIDDLSGSLLAITDGKTLWRAAPDTREFIRGAANNPVLETKGGGPIAEMAIRRVPLALNFQSSRLTNNLKHAQQLPNETIEAAGHPVECLVVRADYTPHGAAPGIDAWSQTFWIHPKSKLVLKSESTSRGHQYPNQPHLETTSRHITRYTVAKINEPLPPTLFQFTPPPHYREVDRLERAYPRPALDLIGKQTPDLGLPQHKGKVIVLDFWATWCEPCRVQMPALAKLHQELSKQDAVLIGINDDESAEKATQYMQEKGYTWPMLHDGKLGALRKKFRVDSIPTLIVIDKSGKIIAYEVGHSAGAEQAIRAAINQAIHAAAPSAPATPQ
jgi:thiol-disulfide isomerase/thioredoxin